MCHEQKQVSTGEVFDPKSSCDLEIDAIPLASHQTTLEREKPEESGQDKQCENYLSKSQISPFSNIEGNTHKVLIN